MLRGAMRTTIPLEEVHWDLRDLLDGGGA